MSPRVRGLRRLLALTALPACGGTAGARLDTSCPDAGPTPERVFAAVGERGIPGPPDTVRLRLGGADIVVGWKNLLSGRELTLSCAYRRRQDEWRLVHARLDEGTHAVRVGGREDPPALIYRDANGRLLEVDAVDPVTEGKGPP